MVQFIVIVSMINKSGEKTEIVSVYGNIHEMELLFRYSYL